GAREAGRDPATVRLGAIFHTVLTADRERALTIGRSMAAGYYEYSPRLFDAPGLRWEGPDVHALQRRVWPDFHHHPDLVASGGLVSFLPDAAADAFAVHGDADAVAAQIAEALAVEPAIEIVVPHPVPVERPSEPRHAGPDYIEAFAREVMPRLRGSSARVRARDERPASAG
ncbi:MAG: LLM class flavin-dependent oxidoreductase, partial [Chloroflexi bacterium]|nr:LLM class flavin-dependent oxidoreductase [Chloroflexota bacterium]